MKIFRMGAFTISFMCIMTVLPVSVVHAGSMNGTEQELISYASETFKYQGDTYKATSAAITKLQAKLEADGVDITESQLASMEAMLVSYIPTGIKNGEIVLVDKEEVESKTESDQEEEDSTTKEEDLEGTISVSNGENTVFDSTLPIKNTGYSIQTALIVTGMLGILFIATVTSAFYMIYFAKKKDE